MWAQEQKPNQSTGGIYATDLSWSPVHIQNVESTGQQTRAESLLLLDLTLGSLLVPWKSKHVHSTNISHAHTIFQALLIDGMGTNINTTLVYNLKVLLGSTHSNSRSPKPNEILDPTWIKTPPKFPRMWNTQLQIVDSVNGCGCLFF